MPASRSYVAIIAQEVRHLERRVYINASTGTLTKQKRCILHIARTSNRENGMILLLRFSGRQWIHRQFAEVGSGPLVIEIERSRLPCPTPSGCRNTSKKVSIPQKNIAYLPSLALWDATGCNFYFGRQPLITCVYLCRVMSNKQLPCKLQVQPQNLFRE